MFDPTRKEYEKAVAKADRRTARELRKLIKTAWTQPGNTVLVELKTGSVVYMAVAESEYSSRFNGFTTSGEYKTFAPNNVKRMEIVAYPKIHRGNRVRFHNGNSFESGVVVSAVTLSKRNRKRFPSAALRLGEQVFVIRQNDGRTFYGVPRWDVYGVTNAK